MVVIEVVEIRVLETVVIEIGVYEMGFRFLDCIYICTSL